MYLKRILIVSLSTIALMQSTMVSAAISGKKCKTIHYQEGRVYSINAKLHHATHVFLPENILGAPINGDIDLWNVEGKVQHLFIQPNSSEKEGKTTTVTVISENNRSYNFIANRTDKNFDACVIVKLTGALLPKDHAMSGYVRPEMRRQQQLQSQVSVLQQQLRNSKQVAMKKTETALQKYRNFIYTRYTWDEGSGFMGTDAISDVYDDGRFTYIRMKHDNKGLLSVSAQIDDKEEFIEFKYDDKNNIYKVSGIYPAFNLAYGENQKITVTRKDNLTQGQY